MCGKGSCIGLHARAAFASLLVALFVATAPTGRAWAATLDPMALARIESLIESDPAEALAEIDGELSSTDGDAAGVDPRQRFDLLRMRARAAVSLGRPLDAARSLVAAATLAAQERERLGDDPVPLLHEAAEAFREGNAPREAERVLKAILEEQTAAVLPVADRMATARELIASAEARGDAAAVARYDAVVEALRAPRDDASATRGGEGGYRLVRVHYATDRARTGQPEAALFYGGDRGEGLDYGVAEVTIPDRHEPGALEAPSIWRLEFSETPARHVVLRSVAPLAENAFFDSLREEVGRLRDRTAFVYVHGYNQSFEKAAKRAAQIAHDMRFDGVPIAYSWPSRGSVGAYVADSAVVRLSGRRLSGFLERVARGSGAEVVHVVAHSMGNRALTDALELMALRLGPKPPEMFGQLIFAAPDVDADLFEMMVRTIRPLARRLTLYASNEDWALKASQALHGDAPRAGQTSAETDFGDEMDAVDMSALGEDMLAHGYFADDSSALVDLATLFWRDAEPSRRCGLEPSELRWRFSPDACDGALMLNLLASLRANGIETGDARSLLVELLGDEALAERVAPDLERLLQGEGQ